MPLAAIPWWGLVSAALAPVLFLAGYLYAASLTSSYALVTTTVSDLGAVETPTRWLMTFTLVFVGMAHVATALALRPVDVAGRWLLAAGGIAMIVLLGMYRIRELRVRPGPLGASARGHGIAAHPGATSRVIEAAQRRAA